MANLIALVGPPGTGKTTSLRGLKPLETCFINVLGKPLPWKGSAAAFNAEAKNLLYPNSWSDVTAGLVQVSENRPEVKTVIIDDAGFLMSIEFFKRAGESGYSKFSEIGQHMFEVINTAKNLREDLNVVFIFHEDLTIVDGFRPQRRIKTIGKMLEDKFTPEALFTHVFWSTVLEDGEGGAEYKFITNRGAGYPAKSPLGMFEETFVDNDLQKILEIMSNYYNN